VSFIETTHGQRAGWQRRAAAELTAILAAHRDLPVIAWTLGPAGATLIGHVNSFASAQQVHRVFNAWRAALGLSEQRQTASGNGTAYLRAVVHRNRVRIALTATVSDGAR
jgi:hypothetical protein